MGAYVGRFVCADKYPDSSPYRQDTLPSANTMENADFVLLLCRQERTEGRTIQPSREPPCHWAFSFGFLFIVKVISFSAPSGNEIVSEASWWPSALAVKVIFESGSNCDVR